MRIPNYYWSLFFVISIVGCNSSKQLQRIYDFPDICRENYEFFLNRIIRVDDGLLEFTEPVDKTYEQLLSKHYNNEGNCWSDVLPEEGILKLFGVPHKRDIGTASGEITLTYFIRTKQCMDLDNLTRVDEKCGNLIFFFSKDGEPKGSIFHALGAAKKEN